MMDEKTKVTAYLDANTIAKLKGMMKADDRSMAYLLEKAVLDLIGKPENMAKWRQVDIEDQLGRPVSAKGASTLKRLGTRSARVADRMSKAK
jgi:hypothetical protein